MKKIIFIIFIFLILIFLYGRYIEPNNFKIKNYTISSDKISESFHELKIVQFSDLLYNKDKKKLDFYQEKINDLSPDIIIFTGDLFNSKYKYSKDNFNDIKKFLSNLNVSLYKYAVIGDNDKKYLDKYIDILYESDFILLNDDNFLLFYKDNKPINIIGISNDDKLGELINNEIENCYNLVLTHNPEININENDIDLILSGHTLGGIINVPYYGGIIKHKDTTQYINEYYKKNNTEIYISNGLGNEYYDFRLFNTPSINVFRFS